MRFADGMGWLNNFKNELVVRVLIPHIILLKSTFVPVNISVELPLINKDEIYGVFGFPIV